MEVQDIKISRFQDSIEVRDTLIAIPIRIPSAIHLEATRDYEGDGAGGADAEMVHCLKKG